MITYRVDFQEWAWHQPLKAAPIFILIIGCGGGGNGNSSRPDEGASDPTPALTWYPDIDKDGLGDFSDASEAAQRPDGYVSDHSDCQDLDPTIHPNATEICGDDIDQDFSGEDLACYPTPAPARFCIITDIHHSNRPDSTTRKYLDALDKAAYFVTRMGVRASISLLNWAIWWPGTKGLDWLEADLAPSNLPTILHPHQTLHLDASEAVSDDLIIKNAAAVRSLLGIDGQVLAAFS